VARDTATSELDWEQERGVGRGLNVANHKFRMQSNAFSTHKHTCPLHPTDCVLMDAKTALRLAKTCSSGEAGGYTYHVIQLTLLSGVTRSVSLILAPGTTMSSPEGAWNDRPSSAGGEERSGVPAHA